MKIRAFILTALALLFLGIPFSSFSDDDEEDREDAHTTGCLPKTNVQQPATACASCHKDASKRWASSKTRPCTPYCATCHKEKEMSRHHPVGSKLPKSPEEGMPLTAEMKLACFTCHNMSQKRYDKQRWKATSLFNRLFRPEERYKTYFLTHRNEQGELCLSCH